jgi:hypothetical protein
MKKFNLDYTDELKLAVEHTHNCKASYIEEIKIIEKFGDKIVWQGVVHIFKIEGHPKTDICYAWSSSIEGSKKRRYYAVLKIPPIDSPEKAIRASVVKDYKEKN